MIAVLQGRAVEQRSVDRLDQLWRGLAVVAQTPPERTAVAAEIAAVEGVGLQHRQRHRVRQQLLGQLRALLAADTAAHVVLGEPVAQLVFDLALIQVGEFVQHDPRRAQRVEEVAL